MVLAAALLSSNPATASTISYGDLASWQAAVTGVTTITFEENGQFGFTIHTPTATFNGIDFSVDAGNLYTVDPSFDPTLYGQIGTDDVLSAQQGATTLTVSSLAATALAFDWAIPEFATDATLSILLSNGDLFVIPALAGSTGFFGITSSVPITGLSISGFSFGSQFDMLNIDNFATASASAVPEPASLSLLALGLMGVGVRRWRSRKA